MRFTNLTYEVLQRGGGSGTPNVGEMLLKVGKLLTCLPVLKRLATGKSSTQQRTVVRDASGEFKNNCLTLVIGPPSCGKSSLLKLCSGLVRPYRNHK